MIGSGCHRASDKKTTEHQEAAPPVAEKAEPSPTPVPINRNAQVVVLGYHRVVDNVRHPDTEITKADFEKQMQQIKDEGITVIPMRDFLAWTQFIIVTHSKKTMTCANTIYGVTMQESGVSKQVSVRFEDVSDDGHISPERLAEAEKEAEKDSQAA